VKFVQTALRYTASVLWQNYELLLSSSNFETFLRYGDFRAENHDLLYPPLIKQWWFCDLASIILVQYHWVTGGKTSR